MLTALMQKLFFGGLKVPPSPKWKNKAKALGEVSEQWLERGGGRLKVVTISPRKCSSGCNCLAHQVVIFAHPITKKAKYFFTDTSRAATYLNCGATVVMFDFNGFGESDSIDLFYWKDAAAVVDWAGKYFPQKGITLHGASFGAFHVIRAMSALPPQSRLVLENVNKSLRSYWKRWPVTRCCVLALEALRVPAIRDMNVKQYLQFCERKDVHVKFIACEKDVLTTAEEMQELYANVVSENKSWALFDGASHLTANIKHKLMYQRVLKGEVCQLC